MTAFDHWKQMLRVFSHVRRPNEVFLTSLVSILYFQMKTMPEDFMVDIVSSNNVVLQCLNRMFKNTDGNASLRKRQYNINDINWDFNDPARVHFLLYNAIYFR